MRLVVFANNRVGLEGVRLLRRSGVELVGLVVHPPKTARLREEIIAASGLSADRVFDGSTLREQATIERITALKPDRGLSLFFAYILKQEILDIFRGGVVNLHPSLLPHARGRFPNVWCIVDRLPAGVTLHLIDSGVDTGPIIAQRPVRVESWDTGLTLYDRLEQASLALLAEALPLLSAPEIPTSVQSGDHKTNRGNDVERIDQVELDRTYTGREIIDILRARTFPPHKGAYFIDDNGVRVDLRLELKPELPASNDVSAEPPVASSPSPSTATVRGNGSNYLYAGCKPWHRAQFEQLAATSPGQWHFAASPAELTVERVTELRPRYIFFPHWSWKVPVELTDNYECVCFHVGDLPRDRGGSPVQNQIARGRRSSFLCALRMAQEIDAGPVYTRIPLSLEGGGEEIFLRMTREAQRVIEWMVREEPTPLPQEGTPEFLPRRKPAQSVLDGSQEDLLRVHDHIRMLDADGYPPAFTEMGNLRMTFKRSALYHDHIDADVRITMIDPNRKESKS